MKTIGNEKAIRPQDTGCGITKTAPDFSFSVSGSRICVHITPVPGADGYEVLQSAPPRGKYSVAASGASPVLEFSVPKGGSCRCKVRAYRGSGEERIFTELSACRRVDIVSAAKERDARIGEFFESIKRVGNVLSYEDLDIAIESLKVAGLEVNQREERRRLEEEAEKKKKEIEEKRKRRLAAAKRAEARREKKRLEHIEKVTRMDLPTDFVNAYSEDDRAEVRCDSAADGLMKSLDMLGMVDIEFIASVTGLDMKTVIERLKGSIYQNPLHWNEVFYKGWETADEYLSGNLMHKYATAKEANEKYNGYFSSNVTALEGVLEPDIEAEDIYAALGSPWIPTDVIDEFIVYMAFGDDTDSSEAKEYYKQCEERDFAVRHDEFTGYWEIPEKTRFRKSYFHGKFDEPNYRTYGTERMDMLYVLENTLNMKTLSVSDPKDPGDPECKVRIVNREETVKLLEKQRYMAETFRKWVWEDEGRKSRLRAAYIRRYGSVRRRVFDGSFLEFPGMNGDIRLYDYQKNAVARIILSPNTLLAHEVGSGKTYVMIAAGMELKRLKRNTKNLYVVPNNIVTQWESSFKRMYPGANILTVTNLNFCPNRRAETLSRIKNEDFDAILMTYSCFDMLSLSNRYYTALYEERLAMLDKAINVFHSSAAVERKRKKIAATLTKLREGYKKTPKVIPFDELGITTLFLDEAHNYKNIDLESRIAGVRGTASTGSDKSNGMMDKVHCVQRMNNGGRVVFATGTPVTNSLSDIYVMQKYLQEGELEFLGIRSFDAWAGMFAEKTTDLEIDVDTDGYHLVTRFSRFRNIPELAATLSSVADFHKTDKTAGIPELEGYEDSLRDGSQDFKDYLREISNRADDIHRKRVKVREDNMLKVTSDGRKAALDMRLIDEAFGLDPDSKVMRCAENVMAVYEATRASRGTQLVFCDISTPKEGFNLYDDLKDILIAMGMPKKEIAFIHDAKTDLQRQELFGAMCEGGIAVLIGSTSKMGHGVNVQKHLAALHHLDVPWRPSDMVQREGRILRRGNENAKVKIFRYITAASFDAYSWQLLETKQRFIGQIMSGEVTARDGGDIDDTVLNYAEVKALAVGNRKIKKRVEICNELDKYRILQRDYMNDRHKKERCVRTLPAEIEEQKALIAACEKDIEHYLKERVDYDSMPYSEQKAIRKAVYDAALGNQNNPSDTYVLTYQGFKVIVPAYMMPRKAARKSGAADAGVEFAGAGKPLPYIHLVNNGTYYIEIESESGVTRRLNNFLENLGVQKEKYAAKLNALESRFALAKAELAKEDGGYTEKIRQLCKELDEINAELGVA